jgi:hypothetical protein
MDIKLKTKAEINGSSVIPVEATRYSVTKKKQKNDNLGDQAKVFEKYEKE